MSQQNQKVVVVAGASLALVVAVGAFLYFRKRSQEYEDENENDCKEELEFADLNTGEESVASAGQSIVKVKVPHHVVGIIIGKEGSNVKQLRAEFGVRFNFDRDETTENTFGNEASNKRSDRTLEIRGQREKVRDAEQKIYAIIAETPKYVETEVFVPSDTCGRIIGKGGQNIREMCSVSGAKILLERNETPSLGNQRRVTLSGTTVQVEYAKLLVKEKVEQAKADTYKYGRDGDELKSKNFYNFQHVTLPNTGEYFQVFVSSCQSPDQFWVQLVSKESTKLDQMTNELAEVYNKLKPEEERLEIGNKGDLCIAPYEEEGEWYRAAISKLNQDRTADVFYLDYGDNGTVGIDEIKKIRPEFKELYGQAVLCKLPVKQSGDEWTDEAIEEFRNITHCAQWKPLMSKVIHLEKNENNFIYHLQLVDTSQNEDVDVAVALVQKGYAVADDAPEEEKKVV